MNFNRPLFATFVVLLCLVFVTACSSTTPDDVIDEAEARTSTTVESTPETTETTATTLGASLIPPVTLTQPPTTPAPTTAPTTTEAPPPPTTAAPILTDDEIDRLALTLTMCTEVGFAEGIDWCTVDSDDPYLEEMIVAACELIVIIDPYGTLSETSFFDSMAINMMGLIDTGEMTMAEAEMFAVFIGAVYGINESLCP